MSDLARIIHKAVTDQEFRAALIADPSSALAHYGLAVSDGEMIALSDTVHLLSYSSEDLLAKLLATASGPEQVWQQKSGSRRFSVSEL